MKIKVVQMIYGNLLESDSWFQWVEKINQLYCDIHGYEYIVDRRTEIRPDRHGNWMKVTAIKENLHDCDFLLSLEGDVAVYCAAIALEEDVIPLLPADKSVLTSVNTLKHGLWGGETSAVWSMLWRNTEIAHEIAAEWDNSHHVAGLQWTAFRHCFDEEGWRQYIVHKYGNHIHTLNDYYLLATIQGYFLRHLAYHPDQVRYKLFKAMWESPMMARNRLLLAHGRFLRGVSADTP